MQALKSFLNRYYTALTFFVAVFLPLLPFALLLFISEIKDVISPRLLFVPFVILSAVLGGLRAGATTTILSTAALFSQLVITPNQPIRFFIDNGAFLLEGILVSIAIEYFKHSEQEQRFRSREIKYKQLIEKLEKERERNLAEVKARDEFLSIASHELRTPLTSMLLQIQRAVYNIQNVSLANFSVQHLLTMLESVEQQSKRLTRMINDLLNVSLITTGRMELEVEEADLVELTRGVVARFSEELEKNTIPFTFTSDTSITIHGDKLRIEQVLSNLITNAIKYGNNQPITLSVFKRGNHAEIKVKDNGIGIPKDKQKLIFERFRRANDGMDIQGLGIGLYITYQIVKAHEGSIQVDSKPGNGTTFTIKLPLQGPKNNKQKHA